MLLLLALLQAADTIRIDRISSPVTFDGAASADEYGAPTITMTRAGGAVQLWLRQSEGQVYLAARIADSTYYWGDDLVIGLDTGGDRGEGPGHDDFQWYFRRMLDSSIVRRGDGGKWRMPRDDPDWKLGTARDGGGWDVRSVNDAAGWSVELKLDPFYFSQAGDRTPGIAFRVYDDNPHGWTPWPNPAGIKQPTDVEDRPRYWVPVVLPP
jgi:hypothetical protein